VELLEICYVSFRKHIGDFIYNQSVCLLIVACKRMRLLLDEVEFQIVETFKISYSVQLALVQERNMQKNIM